jgi:hypothetical protein
MADDDSDFKDILEGTVDEVKDRIRDLDSPDYEGLLEAEEDGKDRKTVKEFLESRIDSEDEEDDVEVKDPEEMVQGIEDETEGGLLGSFSRESVLAGGLILGLVIGFAAAGLTSGATAQANPQQVQENVRAIAGAGGNISVEVSPPEVRHSMYHMNVTISQQTENGTTTQSQEVYTTLDGRYLFLVQRQFGQLIRPIDIPQTLEQLEQQQNQEDQTAPGNGQSPTGNTTQ